MKFAERAHLGNFAKMSSRIVNCHNYPLSPCSIGLKQLIEPYNVKISGNQGSRREIEVKRGFRKGNGGLF